MPFPPVPSSRPSVSTSDFQMAPVYMSMNAETIARLPEKQAREALSSVKTAKLELFRTAVRTMATSTLFTFIAQHEMLMTEMFHGAPKYTEYQSTMIIASARVALTAEIDRRIPIPK